MIESQRRKNSAWLKDGNQRDVEKCNEIYVSFSNAVKGVMLIYYIYLYRTSSWYQEEYCIFNYGDNDL